MKYSEIKNGEYAGYYKDENGTVYTARVALKRMANPDLYDPKPTKSEKKKKALKDK